VAVIPALASVLVMIDIGFSDSFWVALDSKAASNCWSGLVEEEVEALEVLELLLELESVLESVEDA
jgi:hypothetical protein